MRSAFTPIMGWLILLSGCAEPTELPVAQASPAPASQSSTAATNSQPLACTIHGNPVCKLGRAPQIKVSLINQTKRDIYLVGSLDASDCKWRYPHCYFEVTGPDGKAVVDDVGRCGFMNALRLEDFVLVLPGEAFDPYQRIDDYGFFASHQLRSSTFQQPGEYRIRFIYSTKNANMAPWLGVGSPAEESKAEIASLFQQVPKIEVRSDEFTLTVVAPDK